MQWTGIEIDVQDDGGEEAVIQVLLNAGCTGVALRDNGGKQAVGSYIPSDERTDERLRQIKGALLILSDLGVDGVGIPRTSVVDEEDWANAWKAYFKPLRVGRRLVVTPPWETPTLKKHDLVITIDPGMAFGTGTHATTQLCMALIEEYLIPGSSVADIGTGSGILSIAAKLLGAATVTAIDNDPLAVKIAAANTLVNGTEVNVGDAVLPGLMVDLVVANIIADTLIELADMLAGITNPEGVLIASGIIDERQNDVRIFIEGAGFMSLETRTQGEWVALVFRRTSD